MHAAPVARLLEAVMFSHTVHTVIVLGLINILAAASTLEAANKRRCGNPPSKVTRVQLLSSTATTLGLGEVRHVVERTWQAEGLDFEWVDTPRPGRLEDVDVTVIVAGIVVARGPAAGARRRPVRRRTAPKVRCACPPARSSNGSRERMIAARVWPLRDERGFRGPERHRDDGTRACLCDCARDWPRAPRVEGTQPRRRDERQLCRCSGTGRRRAGDDTGRRRPGSACG